jgi:UDP-N-acetylmuramoylalanine--D-glutamate ligase
MEWQGKRMIVIGAARQGTVLARYLAQKGAWVVVNDQRGPDQLKPALESLSDVDVEWALGGHPLEILDGADYVCPSGGVPLDLQLIQEALRRGIPLTNDSQIFLESAPCQVIGITGSAGKTTTTTLVGRIAEAVRNSNVPEFIPRRVWVGGNIGNPLLAVLDSIQANDLAVMELSSFQLEVMCASPQVAVVLNITPNHLDRHTSMDSYIAAKRRILEYQHEEDAAVLGSDDPGAWSLAPEVQARSLWTFGAHLDDSGHYPGTFLREEAIWLWDGVQEHKLIPLELISLRGEHNRLNALAACAAIGAAGLPLAAAREGVRGFAGVPHRLEFVRTWGGADWYNDSIATAPERTIAALRAFEEPIILLAGGRDKNLPWEHFAALVCKRVDHLVLFGEAAPKIAEAVQQNRQGDHPYSLHICSELQEAIRTAASLVKPGDVVLLSPGGTSFDEFRDFEARGEGFRKWVHEL